MPIGSPASPPTDRQDHTGTGPWEVIRYNRNSTFHYQVISSGHDTCDAAATWLGAQFDAKAEDSDWPPTRAQLRRAAAQIRNQHQTRLFGALYRVHYREATPR